MLDTCVILSPSNRAEITLTRIGVLMFGVAPAAALKTMVLSASAVHVNWMAASVNVLESVKMAVTWALAAVRSVAWTLSMIHCLKLAMVVWFAPDAAMVRS